MKNLTIITSVALLLMSLGSIAQQAELPRAFYKRCLVSSISGGPSRAIYTTFDNEGTRIKSDIAPGVIDPFIMEFGLNNKLGIGFSSGGETYGINVNDYYKAEMPEGMQFMNAQTKYLTLDLSYHPLVTKRMDISLFGAAGYFKVSGTASGFMMDGTIDQNTMYCTPPTKTFSYNGKGAVVRTGVRSRFYFTKRFGFMAMAYAFNGYVKEKQKPNPISDQKNNTGYGTMITGAGLEFGICFRIFKQKNVVKETAPIEVIEEPGMNTASVSGLFGADSF